MTKTETVESNPGPKGAELCLTPLLPGWLIKGIFGFSGLVMAMSVASMGRAVWDGKEFSSASVYAALAGASLAIIAPLASRLKELTLKMGDKEMGFKLQELQSRVEATETKAEKAEEKAETAKKDARGALNRTLADSIDTSEQLAKREQGLLALIAGKLGGQKEIHELVMDSSGLSALPNALRAEVINSDPNKGLFGGKRAAKGRELIATVKPIDGDGGWCEITLEVRSTPGSQPLTGVVTFFTHPTFPKTMLRAPVFEGRAIQKLIAWGAFTVGALADDGATELELDLSGPDVDAPEVFKSR